MRISPKETSYFDIPSFRMVLMPLVRLTLDSGIKKLKAEFFHGYHLDASIFYLSLYHENGEVKIVT